MCAYACCVTSLPCCMWLCTSVPGDRLVSVCVEGWQLGLSVCYDLRFPALYEALRYPTPYFPAPLAPAFQPTSIDKQSSKGEDDEHGGSAGEGGGGGRGGCSGVNSTAKSCSGQQGQQRRQKGAELLLVPSAFTERTGRAHWEVLLRARAIETQCYVIAAAQAGEQHHICQSASHSSVQPVSGPSIHPSNYPSIHSSIQNCAFFTIFIFFSLYANLRARQPRMSISGICLGRHNDKRTSYGHTLIIDPWGTVVARLGGAEGEGTGEGVCHAQLSRSLLQEVRSNMPIQVR